MCEHLSISNGLEAGTTDVEARSFDSKLVTDEEKVSTKINCYAVEKPLNFDKFSSVTKLEVFFNCLF